MQRERNEQGPRKRPGIRERHARKCAARAGGRCSCTPTFQADVYDPRVARQVFRTFPTRTAAKLWRRDAQVAIARGTLNKPSATTFAEVAEQLIADLRDGSVLDRTGKPYKPSTARSYVQALRGYAIARLGPMRLSAIRRQDIQRWVEDLSAAGLSPSTVHNKLDPLRVIFRRALRDDVIGIDPTDGLELPSVRGRRDRIETPEQAAALLAALPPGEQALWSCALFAGLRRGELRQLCWDDVDFDRGIVRVDGAWDDVEGKIDPKSTAGRRAVPMAPALRRLLAAHKLATGRDGDDLVFGRTATDPFVASTVRGRALRAWGWGQDPKTKRWEPGPAALVPLSLHEARHCAVSYFIAAGMDWKQISAWAGHGDVRQTWNRYGHLVPGGEAEAAAKLGAYLEPTMAQFAPTMAPTMAHPTETAENAAVVGLSQYRYGDSKPGQLPARRAKRP